MGLQDGIIKITGTIDNLTFYKMNGIYYVRKKSSLSRKKVLTAPSFERTRMHAGEFKIASKIASRLYRPIKKEDKSIHLFRKMVGRAKTLLHKGNQIDQIILIITDELIQLIADAKQKMQPKTNKEKKAIAPKSQKEIPVINLQLCQLNTERPNIQTIRKESESSRRELSNIYVDRNGKLSILTLTTE